MKTVLIDASSAILLFKVDLFEKLTLAYRVFMVPKVFEEVSVSGLPGFTYFNSALNSGQLNVIQATAPEKLATMEGMDRLGPGERDTIYAFASGRADFIILDDRRGAQLCRARNIPYINALLCPKLFFFTGLISQQQLEKSFKALIRIGYYSKAVINYARLCTDKVLADFLVEGKRGRHSASRDESVLESG